MSINRPNVLSDYGSGFEVTMQHARLAPLRGGGPPIAGLGEMGARDRRASFAVTEGEDREHD